MIASRRSKAQVLTMLTAFICLTMPVQRSMAVTGQKSFLTPQLAVTSLVAAVQNEDEAELVNIFGPGSDELIASGDKIADHNGRTRFLKAYEQKHNLEAVNENRVILVIGDKDYPLPIPIVRRNNAWFFDTPAGKEEILNRRIGRNELRTIELMQAYTEAQREYSGMIREGGTPVFAQKLASSEGKKDGLYWDVTAGEKESPLGPLVAKAAAKGYTEGLQSGSPDPFYGYYFKILKAQGQHADGGAFDYVRDGKMILGFALVAYPAKYGASGIMTFIVNQEGQIYEKDLGEQTSAVAEAMTSFDPDSTWRKYEDTQ